MSRADGRRRLKGLADPGACLSRPCIRAPGGTTALTNCYRRLTPLPAPAAGKPRRETGCHSKP